MVYLSMISIKNHSTGVYHHIKPHKTSSRLARAFDSLTSCKICTSNTPKMDTDFETEVSISCICIATAEHVKMEIIAI